MLGRVASGGSVSWVGSMPGVQSIERSNAPPPPARSAYTETTHPVPLSHTLFDHKEPLQLLPYFSSRTLHEVLRAVARVSPRNVQDTQISERRSARWGYPERNEGSSPSQSLKQVLDALPNHDHGTWLHADQRNRDVFHPLSLPPKAVPCIAPIRT